MAPKSGRRSLWPDRDEPEAGGSGSAGAAPSAMPSDPPLRITVYATVDQVEKLDRDKIRIRRTHRRVLDRTAIIRGLLEGYRRSELDLAAMGITSEEELAALIEARLRGAER